MQNLKEDLESDLRKVVCDHNRLKNKNTAKKM
jgi:hypothetical protein